jgi:hypothetical protein
MGDLLDPGHRWCTPGYTETIKFSWTFVSDSAVIMVAGPHLQINFNIERSSSGQKCSLLDNNPNMTVQGGDFAQKPTYGQNYYADPSRCPATCTHYPNPVEIWKPNSDGKPKQSFQIVMMASNAMYESALGLEMHAQYFYEPFSGAPPTPPSTPPVTPPVTPPTQPPVTPPTQPPVTPPVTPPTQPHVTPPVTPPTEPPVTPPTQPPVTPPPPPALGMILEAEKRSVKSGDKVIVPVWLKNATDVANMNFTVSYTDSIIRAEGDSTQGSLDSGAIFAANPHQSGLVRVGFAQTAGMNGSGTVVLVPFRAIGQAGTQSPLHLEITTVNNPGGAKLTVARVDGWVRIVDKNGLVPGHCDGHEDIKPIDAMCALKMSVQLIPVQSQMDMDGDGQVTSRDAVIILKIAMGLISVR